MSLSKLLKIILFNFVLILFDTCPTVHYVQFVKYDVTVSFMAQVLDTVTYWCPRYWIQVIIKFPCALQQTGHLATVHAPVLNTVAYIAGLDAPVVDTVTYFGGNHRPRG